MANSKITKEIDLFLGYCHEHSKAVERYRLARNVPLPSDIIYEIFGDKPKTKSIKRKVKNK